MSAHASPRMLLALVPLALAACAGPSPALRDGQGARVLVEGSRFAVYWRADLAEAWRISPEALPERARVLRQGQLAITRATGCPVRAGSLRGDQALVVARLACPDGAPPPALAAWLVYECRIADSWDIASLEVTMEAIECSLTGP